MEKWNDEFDFSSFLEENHKYRLYWTNLPNDRIEIGIEAETTGWLAFGLSSNGAMENSDIMIGWVDDNDGVAHLQDRHTTDTRDEGPILDSINNLELIGGEQEDGITRIRFRRDKCTTDLDQDLGVVEGTSRVIYAFHQMDPTTELFDYSKNPGSIEYHGMNRGSQSVNLYHGQDAVVQLEDDLESFDLLMDSWAVATKRTTYICRAFKLPEYEEKRHIVKIEPAIQHGNEGTVHHIVGYLCPEDEMSKDLEMFNRDNSQELCDEFSTNMPHPDCRGGQIQFLWAVGGGDQYYPAEAALPFGGDTNFHYAFFEMHYDNPEHRDDIVDSSGLRIYHTAQLRQYDVATLMVGVLVHPFKQFVPPKMITLNTGWCSSECTEKGLPDEGITVFASGLHAHQVGVAMAMRHIRNGQELEPIEVNDNYDFNYQQGTRLAHPRKILPGDKLVMHCKYDTNERDEITWGGFESNDEMCLGFLSVYPKPELYSCLTGFSGNAVSSWITDAIMAGYLEIDDPSDTFGRLGAGDGDALSDIHWNMDGSGDAMYEKLWGNGEYGEKSLWCGNDGNFMHFVVREDSSYEKDIGSFTQWENPNQCSNINWDDWIVQAEMMESTEEIKIPKAAKIPQDVKESAAHSFVVGIVGLILILKQILRL